MLLIWEPYFERSFLPALKVFLFLEFCGQLSEKHHKLSQNSEPSLPALSLQEAECGLSQNTHPHYNPPSGPHSTCVTFVDPNPQDRCPVRFSPTGCHLTIHREVVWLPST